MSEHLQLDAVTRSDVGKGASRRLRRKDEIPAVIYGGNKAAESLTVNHNKAIKALENEAFYSSVLTININGKPEQAVLKAMQRHPYKPKVLHMDFLRVSATDQLQMNVPIHYLNEDKCVGVKAGGILSKQMTEIEVRCLATDLPEFIEIDVADLELDQTLHLSDLQLPKGVESSILAQDAEQNLAVASVQKARAAKVGGDDADGSAAEEGESNTSE